MVRAPPFHCTTELSMKLLPLTVSVKFAPPTRTEAGLRLAIVGTGFPAAALIVKLKPLETPAGAGLSTVTWAVPLAVISLAGMAAVN